MSDFRKLSDTIWASPQIAKEDILEAGRRGFTMIMNNRPDNETEGQPSGAEIESAARNAGMEYCAIPVTHAGFSMAQVDAMLDALSNADGPVLAYCRSGTRSTLLWSLARAKAGDDPSAIAQAAAEAGYDVGPVREIIDQLASSATR